MTDGVHLEYLANGGNVTATLVNPNINPSAVAEHTMQDDETLAEFKERVEGFMASYVTGDEPVDEVAITEEPAKRGRKPLKK